MGASFLDIHVGKFPVVQLQGRPDMQASVVL